jgi:hypothetical protein
MSNPSSSQFPAQTRWGGAVIKTANYSVAVTDSGLWLIFNSSSPVTLTLLASIPDIRFIIGVVNIGTGALTIARNGLTINGSASDITLLTNQSTIITTDGNNYFAGQTGDLSTVYQVRSEKDAANGYAGLDANAHLKDTEKNLTIDARTSTTEAIADSDRGKLVTFSNASAVAATIAQAGAGGNFVAGWFCFIQNLGAGRVTLTPTTSTINGGATFVLEANQGALLVSDGTNYIAVMPFSGLQTVAPNDGDIPVYVNADKKWEPKSISTLGGANASKLRGVNISSATPLDQQILRYSSADAQYDLVYTDGLIHGDTFFGGDPSVLIWRDDFIRSGTLAAGTDAPGNNLGELGWDATTPAGGVQAKKTAISGGFTAGFLGWTPGTGQNAFASLNWPRGQATPSLSTANGGMPLMDYPGWKMVWIFGFPFENSPSNTQYSFAKKQMYVGLACGRLKGATWTTSGVAQDTAGEQVSTRPPYFLGLRLDTTPAFSLTITSVNNAASGVTRYNGTWTRSNPVFAGMSFTVSGFTNAGNNGTFTCVNIGTNFIDLANPNGVAETKTVTMTSTAIGDSTFMFEAVNNINIGNQRINDQGTTFNTSITPAQGALYRFEMVCTASGTVTMTLVGNGSSSSHTFTGISKTTTDGTKGGARIDLSRQNGLGEVFQPVQVTQSATTSTLTSNMFFTVGSKVTISNAPVGKEFYNGTFVIKSLDVGGPNAIGGLFDLSGATDNSTNTGALLTYYPGLYPYAAFGNSNEASPVTNLFSIDFFSLVWNSGIATSPDTISTNKPRYWSTSP